MKQGHWRSELVHLCVSESYARRPDPVRLWAQFARILVRESKRLALAGDHLGKRKSPKFQKR